MSFSGRPSYIPSHKRKQQRLHGAFTGGFSAGYFNTVGTKEGWKPRENSRESQRLEDYMDEADYDEWAGPKAVKQEFTTTSLGDADAVPSIKALDLIHPVPHVGERLLRVLGWRQGSTAYVPSNHPNPDDKQSEDMATTLLSQKRLRRIQLQQRRVSIPTPKHDRGGLGYDVYAGAPEFQAFRHKRRKQAKQKTVYRLSDLQGAAVVKSAQQHEDKDFGDGNDEHETVQDFIGTKTVGGFAIREDDDDVYDEHPNHEDFIDKEEYDTTVYDHESDDEDGTDKNKRDNNGSLSGLFSSWVTGGDNPEDSVGGVTSDGRPPLPGFCLGGSTVQRVAQRFPGPELPSGHILKRHEFQDDEHPANYLQVSQREKLRQQEQQRQAAATKIQDPMAGVAFLGLAAAMKSRFTSASAPTAEQAEPMPVGLHRPIRSHDSRNVGQSTSAVAELHPPKEAKIIRSYMLFYPDPLVCKRFGVSPPIHSKTVTPGQLPSGESKFFEEQVLKQAEKARIEARKVPVKEFLLSGSQADAEPKETDQRPAMEIYKSIFESASESESDNDVKRQDESLSYEKSLSSNAETTGPENDLQQDSLPEQRKTESDIAAVASAQRLMLKTRKRENRDRKRTSQAVLPDEAHYVASPSEGLDQPKRKKKKKKRRKRRLSSSSSDTDLDVSSSSSEGLKKRKKKRHGKKHKKKHKIKNIASGT